MPYKKGKKKNMHLNNLILNKRSEGLTEVKPGHEFF